MKFIVIGGGWAGCAAAWTLASAGHQVVLREAASRLGGRARAVQLGALAVDNGQHILLGAYRSALDLIARVNPVPESALFLRLPLELSRPPDFRLVCPRLPAPLHLAAGLMRARGLSVRARLAALCEARRWLGHAVLPPTVAAALADHHPATRALLWTPLCEAALNTAPVEAATETFRGVLRAALGGRRGDSDLLLPRRDLGALLPDAVAQALRRDGHAVQTGQRVRQLALTATRAEVDGEACDGVVLATAPWHAASLLRQIPCCAGLAAALAPTPTEAIATGYLRYPADTRLPRAMIALAGGPGQFAFDRGVSHGQAGLVAVVASVANTLTGVAHTVWLARMAAQLTPLLGREPLAATGIMEKRATWLASPDAFRPSPRTPAPRLTLAGDYTAGPYPATLEAACASGVESASTLLHTLT